MKIALTNVNIITGRLEDEVLRNKIVIIKNNKIIDICDTLDEKMKCINMHNRYLMPGLINMHVHLPGSGKSNGSKKQTKESVNRLMNNPITRKIAYMLCAKYAKTELLSGVTTIRTVGGLRNFDTSIGLEIEDKKRIGPRIMASNMAISVPGGHMAGILAHEARTPLEAINFVKLINQDKPKYIKLMITGGVMDAKVMGEPGVLRMPKEIVKAAVTEAHELGLKVSAHVESREGLVVAVENGVDTIEHGASMLPQDIDLFKTKKATLITTISPALPFVFLDEDLTEVEKENSKIVLKGIIDCAKTCLENNIKVGLGTDTACPYITHYDMWRELVYFSHIIGVSKKYAIYTATLNNAEILGIDHLTGSIEIGKSADFIVVDDDPTIDLKTIRYPYMVGFRGRIFKKPRVKKYKNVEEKLDYIMEEVLTN